MKLSRRMLFGTPLGLAAVAAAPLLPHRMPLMTGESGPEAYVPVGDGKILIRTFDRDIARFEKKMDALQVDFSRRTRVIDAAQQAMSAKIAAYT